jgi:hypothetical protein
MKLKLHWLERSEVVREYPSFTLTAEQYPELELELQEVYRASSEQEQMKALDNLEYKMHHTQAGERGETIFEMVGPYNSYDQSIVYPIVEEAGSFRITEEK